MKSTFNPNLYMLNEYKRFLDSDYEKSFLIYDNEMDYKKTIAFCKSLVNLMKFKGHPYHYKETDRGIDLFLGNTLVITYQIDLLKNIKNENSLKFQFLIEWGILINFKKNLLIAL